MLSCFSTRDASNILGIKTGRLRYWKRIGLVTPSNLKKGRRCYGFQDLICLKTAQGLVAQGLQATQMRNGVESLKKKFPGFDNYLANKRVYVFGSHAIIRHKDRFIEPQSGQLLFEFDLDDFAEELDTQLADVRERSPVGVKVEILNRPSDWEEVRLVDGILLLGDFVGAEQVRITLADPGNLTPGLKWARKRIRQLQDRGMEDLLRLLPGETDDQPAESGFDSRVVMLRLAIELEEAKRALIYAPYARAPSAELEDLVDAVKDAETFFEGL